MTSVKKHGYRDVNRLLREHKEVSIVMWMNTHHLQYNYRKIFCATFGGKDRKLARSIGPTITSWRAWRPFYGYSSLYYDDPSQEPPTYNNEYARVNIAVVNSTNQSVAMLQSNNKGKIEMTRIYHVIKKLLKD